MKKIALSSILFLSFEVFAGPFGFSSGMTLNDVNKIGDFKPDTNAYWYDSKTIKNGNNNFESYSVLVVPGYGLCKIIAVGKDIISNSYGEQVRTNFDDLTSALKLKYGNPTNQYDFLRSGSIWKDPNDFMMGLAKKDRTLVNYWMVADGSKLPDELKSISLTAGATSSSKGYLTLSYEFSNVSECMAASKMKSNSNL